MSGSEGYFYSLPEIFHHYMKQNSNSKFRLESIYDREFLGSKHLSKTWKTFPDPQLPCSLISSWNPEAICSRKMNHCFLISLQNSAILTHKSFLILFFEDALVFISHTKNYSIIRFRVSYKDGEALYSQQKQDWELTVTRIMNSLLPNSDWIEEGGENQ